jgi:hypothetical protein
LSKLLKDDIAERHAEGRHPIALLRCSQLKFVAKEDSFSVCCLSRENVRLLSTMPDLVPHQTYYTRLPIARHTNALQETTC